jgi:transposase-like protein
MGKRSKKYSPQFKFKVVIETFQKDSVAEVARRYDIHPNQVTMWRKEFQEKGPAIFENGQNKREEEYRKRISQLENLMGKKELEINLLKEFVDFYSPPDGS